MVKRSGLALAMLLGCAPVAAVPPEVEAEQVNIDARGGILALGGSSAQRLAQVFAIARPGYLSHVMVPMSCQPDADVRVTIEKTTSGAPNGAMLAYEELRGRPYTSGPTPAVGMRMIEFTRPPLLGPGEYAVTLAVKGKYDCGVYAGPHGDTYPGGAAYFIARPNPPVWIELFDAGGTRDLAFQIYLRPL